MSDAQANKSVYKRMRANLGGTASNSTGGYDDKKMTPGGTYNRQSAGSADNGKAKYTRKSSGANASNTLNDGYQTKASSKPAVSLSGGKNATGKKGRLAD